ncbi:hypothetical protein Gotur_034895 [Gossypium turneri]
MEKEERSQRTCKKIDSELFLQWGNRKRLRCVRVKDSQNTSNKSNATTRRRFNSSTFSHSNYRLTSSFIQICCEWLWNLSQPPSACKEFSEKMRNSEVSILQSTMTEHQKTSSLEKEDRYYTTRGSAVSLIDENGKVVVDSSSNGDDKKRVVWPKLYITLSSKEKEEDFMAMKGCKPPQRPRKRAKIIQRSLLSELVLGCFFCNWVYLCGKWQLVSPGAWLTDMCQERYEVREKKSSKKLPKSECHSFILFLYVDWDNAETKRIEGHGEYGK